jgi:hypothetical protein
MQQKPLSESKGPQEQIGEEVGPLEKILETFLRSKRVFRALSP